MTDLDPREEPEDPKELRSAAVDALKDAARQSDPREFSRLTRHALDLIERARAIGHGRQHSVSEAAETPTSQQDTASPPSSDKIVELRVKLRRLFSWKSRPRQ